MKQLTYKSILYPTLTFLLALPLLLLLSLGAGFSVWSSSPSNWRQVLWLQYGDHKTPYATTELPPLSVPQSYSISLELTVPLTNPNFDLGNFMAGVEFVSIANNKTLFSARRPCLLPRPRVPFVRSSKRLTVVLSDNVELPASPTRARVEVGRQDTWRGVGNGEGRELTVLSASLRGQVVPKGIRGWLVRYPVLISIISGMAFFVVSLFGLCAGILPAVGSKRMVKQEQE